MLYVTGDIHGDYNRFKQPQFKKLKKGDTLFVCGDFGFIWSGSKAEAKLLKKLGKKKYNICFIDGTHENFELLSKYEVETWNGGKVHHIEGNLYHLMRGQIYEVEGKSIFAMGGGESPDMDFRQEHDTWSGKEVPEKAELLEGAENLHSRDGKVDYIVTHEPPAKIKSFLKLKEKQVPKFTGLNTYFEELADYAKFSHWFFGALHVDKFISSSHIATYKRIYNMETGEALK